MNEWTVVTVIVTLVGLGAAVIKPLLDLTKTITTLTVVVKDLKEDLDTLTTRNSDAHHRLWEKMGEHDTALSQHDERIKNLEGERKEAS